MLGGRFKLDKSVNSFNLLYYRLMRTKEKHPFRKATEPPLRPNPHYKQTYELKNGKHIKKIQIGKYQYNSTDILGQGYTGSVFKATLITDPKQKFAIKVIKMKKFNQPDSLSLIQREIEIHQKLKHPHILNCVDVIKTQEQYFIVTEYCPHGDLQELLKTQKLIHEDVALKIIRQIIDAYKYIMSKNIIHRDLKPANIMRFGSVWKIGDFGFATHCTEDFILDEINLGTPLYMPPQSLFYNKYSSKTDIFSIGIILYQMLTGVTPWPSKTQKQLMQTMKNQKIQIPELIQDPSIRQFLFKSCDIDYYSRMSKDQFKKFSFEEAESRIVRAKSNGMFAKSMKKMILLSPRNPVESNKKIRDCQSPKTTTFIKNQKTNKFDITTQQSNKDSEGSMVEKNLEKVRRQKQFGQKINLLIQNIKYLKLEKEENDRLVILCYKYLIRFMKMLGNPRQNSFKLGCWDATKKNQEFKDLTIEANKDQNQYSTQYTQLSKSFSNQDIKYINRLFPQLSIEAPLGFAFYGNFQQYLKQFLIRNFLQHKKQIKFISFFELNVLKHLKKVYLGIRDKANPTSKLKYELLQIQCMELQIEKKSNEEGYRKTLEEVEQMLRGK